MRAIDARRIWMLTAAVAIAPGVADAQTGTGALASQTTTILATCQLRGSELALRIGFGGNVLVERSPTLSRAQNACIDAALGGPTSRSRAVSVNGAR